MTGVIDRDLMIAETTEEKGVDVLERLFSAAEPRAVFGEPVVSGEYTVITAQEVGLGGGFGLGRGFGPTPAGETTNDGGVAGGSGLGGGGGSGGRPVAVIVIGPQGVQMQPIVDVTKIALRSLFILRGVIGVARLAMLPFRRNR